MENKDFEQEIVRTDMVERLLRQAQVKKELEEKVVVDARTKTFYNRCPHCTSEFYFKFDDVEFKNTIDDVDMDDMKNPNEIFTNVVQMLMNKKIIENNCLKSVSCPICKQDFTPSMNTKDEFDKALNMSSMGGLFGIR